MTGFKDPTTIFSGSARAYNKYRPRYPDELFDFLAAHARRTRLAFDCGTGNGQATPQLCARFSTVVAGDANLAQLSRAQPRKHLHLLACRAGAIPLRDHTADLITIAQALHWFPTESFFREVRRIARPGAVAAAWTYPLLEAGSDIDPLIREFHAVTVGPYWLDGRRHVDEAYRSIPFPFEEFEAPVFTSTAGWRLDDFAGYLTTWSAVEICRLKTGRDPVEPFVDRLRPLWTGRRRVAWRIHLRAGYV